MKTLTVLTLTVLLMATMALTTATAQDWVHTTTLTRHSDDVMAVEFSGGGDKYLASASKNGYLRIWDGDDFSYRKRIGILNAVPATLYSAAIRPGWYEVAVGLDGARIQLNNPKSGGAITTLRYTGDGENEYFYSVAYRPDGDRLAAGDDESRIHIFYTDHQNGNRRHLRTLRGHTSSVYSVAWSPDGRTLASGSHDGTVRLWNPNNGVNFAILRGHTDDVNGVAFSPNGRMLASVSWREPFVILWDVNSQSRIRTMSSGSAHAVAWSPDGQTLAVGEAHDDDIFLFDPNTGNQKQRLSGHSGDVRSVAFDKHGRILASGSDDNTIRIWEPVNRLDVTRNGSVNVNDLVEVAKNYGKTVAGGADRNADVNGDGKVDINDLNEVARALDARAAPGLSPEKAADLPFTAKEVQGWIRDAKAAGIDAHDITVLEQLLTAVTRTPPKKTALLSNYPNPFNPETWIPYQLSEAAEVTVTIHSPDGKLVRTLELGQVPAGIYQSRSRAAYWDGRNAQGESVASGVYFYTLQAGDFSATRKMVIRK